jgi:hypothetical protein
MAVFVLDASIAFSWCFPGDPSENTSYSRAILKRLAVDDAIVPEIWPFEIANGIYVSYSRRKRITEGQIGEYVNFLKASIRVEAQSLMKNIELNPWRAAGASPPTTQPIFIWHYGPGSPSPQPAAHSARRQRPRVFLSHRH